MIGGVPRNWTKSHECDKAQSSGVCSSAAFLLLGRFLRLFGFLQPRRLPGVGVLRALRILPAVQALLDRRLVRRPMRRPDRRLPGLVRLLDHRRLRLATGELQLSQAAIVDVDAVRVGGAELPLQRVGEDDEAPAVVLAGPEGLRQAVDLRRPERHVPVGRSPLLNAQVLVPLHQRHQLEGELLVSLVDEQAVRLRVLDDPSLHERAPRLVAGVRHPGVHTTVPRQPASVEHVTQGRVGHDAAVVLTKRLHGPARALQHEVGPVALRQLGDGRAVEFGATTHHHGVELRLVEVGVFRRHHYVGVGRCGDRSGRG